MEESQFKKHLRRSLAGPLLSMFVLLLALAGLLSYLLASADWVDHTDQVLAQISRVEKLAVDMETGIRGYCLTGDNVFLEPFEAASRVFPAQLSVLRGLVRDNPTQSATVLQLEESHRGWYGFATKARDRATASQPTEVALQLRGKILMDELRGQIATMQNREQSLLAERARTLARLKLAMVPGVLLLGVVFAPLLILTIRRTYSWLDATYREALTDAQRERENLRVTLASIGDAVIATEASGKVTFLNSVAQKMTGWIARDAVGQPVEKIFHIINEDTRQPAENPIHKVLREGVVVGLANHTALIACDGTETSIEDSAAPIKDAAGNVSGVIMVFHDVTLRRRTETNLAFLAAISRDLARLDTVEEIMQTIGAKIGNYFKLSRCNFVEVDEAAEQLVVTHDWHRDDVPSTVGVCCTADYLTEEFKQTCQAGEAFIVRDTEADPRVDGSKYAPLRVRAFVLAPLVRDGKWTFLLNCHDSAPRDWRADEIELMRELAARIWTRLERVRAGVALREIAARYEQQARIFDTTLSSITDFAYMFNREGRFLFVNQPLLNLWGLPLEEAVGKNFFDLKYPEDLAAKLQSQIQQVFDQRKLLRDETTYVSPSGEKGYYEYVFSPVIAADGSCEVVAGSTRDITERRFSEERLERTVAERTAELREINDQLEAFVYSIAHDLRAPLRSMQGFSQTLVEDHAGLLNDQARQYLTRINNSAEFMDKLIIDLLAFGRAGRAQIELDPVEPLKAWENARFQCETEIEKTNAEIQTIGQFPRVIAHEATLSQVLANLLSNSLKFVAPGVQAQIRFWAEEKGAAVRLSIEDNGLGIPKEHQERIFRVFERLHGARYQGTGIGLSIVRKGVERMHGKLGLESAPGKGSRFWIELPKTFSNT